jgi:hypothetical protein
VGIAVALLCSYLSAVPAARQSAGLVLGPGPIAALVIAVIAMKEGCEVWRGHRAADRQDPLSERAEKWLGATVPWQIPTERSRTSSRSNHPPPPFVANTPFTRGDTSPRVQLILRNVGDLGVVAC